MLQLVPLVAQMPLKMPSTAQIHADHQGFLHDLLRDCVREESSDQEQEMIQVLGPDWGFWTAFQVGALFTHLRFLHFRKYTSSTGYQLQALALNHQHSQYHAGLLGAARAAYFLAWREHQGRGEDSPQLLALQERAVEEHYNTQPFQIAAVGCRVQFMGKKPWDGPLGYQVLVKDLSDWKWTPFQEIEHQEYKMARMAEEASARWMEHSGDSEEEEEDCKGRMKWEMRKEVGSWRKVKVESARK